MANGFLNALINFVDLIEIFINCKSRRKLLGEKFSLFAFY